MLRHVVTSFPSAVMVGFFVRDHPAQPQSLRQRLGLILVTTGTAETVPTPVSDTAVHLRVPYGLAAAVSSRFECILGDIV